MKQLFKSGKKQLFVFLFLFLVYWTNNISQRTGNVELGPFSNRESFPPTNINRNPCRFERNQHLADDDSLDGAPPSGTPNILLLSSMGRSGSSFLGGLLSSLPGTFYVFEPLHSLEKSKMLTPSSAANELKKVLLCNFTYPIRTGNLSHDRFHFRHPKAKACKSLECFASVLDETCPSKPFRVAKTIRTRVSWLTHLLDDPEVNLRVIHLLRDPRGSVISGWKLGWDFIKEDAVCNNLKLDMDAGLSLRREKPGKYLAVRYEDLCAKPEEMSEVILSFLGYTKMPQSTLKFIQSNTHVKRDGSPYSVKRDSRLQQQGWRTTITAEELTRIEAACAPVISQLGFNLFGDMQAVRDLSLPLFNTSEARQLYTYDECE